jgi:hypothetical protein
MSAPELRNTFDPFLLYVTVTKISMLPGVLYLKTGRMAWPVKFLLDWTVRCTILLC